MPLERTRGRVDRGWSPEEAVGLTHRPESAFNPKPVTINGIRYPTLKAAAMALGVRLPTVQARIAKGYSTEDAFLGRLKPPIGGHVKAIQFQGKKYRSHTDLASQYGISGALLARRVTSGWTMDQALGLEPAPPRFRNFEGHARDQKWKEVRTTSGKVEPVPDAEGYKLYLVTNSVNDKVYIGLTIGPLENRLKQHFAAARRGRKSAFSNAIRKHGEDVFSVELIRSDAKSYDELQEQEVVEIDRRNSIRDGYNTAHGGSLGTSKEIDIDGRTFSSYAGAAEAHGIDPSVFAMRIGRLKWTPEESAGLIPRNWEGKEVPISIGGKTYPSLRNAAEAHGLDYKLFHERYLTRGWTLEQSIGSAPQPDSAKYGGTSITVFGKNYGSFGEAGRALGVNPESFRKRVQSGMSPEVAYERARKKTAGP